MIETTTSLNHFVVKYVWDDVKLVRTRKNPLWILGRWLNFIILSQMGLPRLLTWACLVNWLYLLHLCPISSLLQGLQRHGDECEYGRPYYVIELIIAVEISLMRRKRLDEDVISSHCRSLVISHNFTLAAMSLNYFDYSPQWWCMSNYSVLLRCNCTVREGKADIDFSHWWRFMATYSELHRCNCAGHEGQPEYTDCWQWGRRMAAYLMLPWVSNTKSKGEASGGKNPRLTWGWRAEINKFQYRTSLLLTKIRQRINYQVRREDELELD